MIVRDGIINKDTMNGRYLVYLSQELSIYIEVLRDHVVRGFGCCCSADVSSAEVSRRVQLEA